MATTAQAHPNIALVKYWGKADASANVPAAPSLSITLDTLVTTTTVAAAGNADQVYLDDEQVDDAKIAAFLAYLRELHNVPPLSIRTHNNFPTAAGLASSASGFAALAAAINEECGLGLGASQLSAIARRGSGSAARSLFGGFVSLQGPDWQARQVLDATAWQLNVVVAVTSTETKATSSSAGMELCRSSSPYYEAWVTSTTEDCAAAETLVAQNNFQELAALAEASCLKMHGLMLSARPGLVYWKPATVACIHTIRQLRADGVPVFFTIDAGPQVKAVCLPAAVETVRAALAQVAGVSELITTGLGSGVTCTRT